MLQDLQELRNCARNLSGNLVCAYLFSDDGDTPDGGAGHRADGHHPEERYGAIEGRLLRRVHENVHCKSEATRHRV